MACGWLWMAVVRYIRSQSHARLTRTLQEDTSESDDRFQAVLELEVVQWRQHSKRVQHSASIHLPYATHVVLLC